MNMEHIEKRDEEVKIRFNMPPVRSQLSQFYLFDQSYYLKKVFQ